MAWPTDWAALFGAERPLILEIGFGYGAYLLHLARTNPDANIVGLEIASQCLFRAESAIDRAGLTNVRPVHSMAETALHHLFTPASLTQIHINFPDPWFKRRHAPRRLMQPDTLTAMVSRMQAGGMLYLATDIREYAEMCAKLFAAAPGLENTLPDAWADQMPGRVVTKYEGRALREGRACHYFALRRNTLPAPDVPVIREGTMPHMVFRSPLTLDDMLAHFQQAERKEGNTHINFLHGYRGQKVVLFEVYIKEPTLDQHVALVLSYRETEQDFTLKAGVLGYPRATEGLHRAVAILGDWLIGLHPDSAQIDYKLLET